MGKGVLGVAVLHDINRLDLCATTRLKKSCTDRWIALVIGCPFSSPIRSRVLSTDQHEQHLHPGASHQREGESLI